MDFLFVAIGGSLGAVLRYSFTKFEPQSGISYVTLLINILGSILFIFLLKNIDQYSLVKTYRPFIFVGFLGAFTTYSTFNYQMIKLLNESISLFIVYSTMTFFIPLIFGLFIYSKA